MIIVVKLRSRSDEGQVRVRRVRKVRNIFGFLDSKAEIKLDYRDNFNESKIV